MRTAPWPARRGASRGWCCLKAGSVRRVRNICCARPGRWWRQALRQVAEAQRHPQPAQGRADGAVQQPLAPQHGRAQRRRGEHPGHHAEPCQVRHRHESAIGPLHRYRGAGVHHLGVGADDEQRGLRVQRIGQQAHAQRRQRGERTAAAQVYRQRVAPAQCLQADPDQIDGAQRLHHRQHAMRVRHQQRHPEHRIEHMHLHAQGDAERAEQAGAAAVQVAVAGDHGEVGAGTDHGQHGHRGDRQGFGERGHVASGYVEFSGRSRFLGIKRTQFCVPESTPTTDIYSRDSVRKTNRCTGWDGSDSSRPRRATRALPGRRRNCT
ncbi:hypothetical protein CBM2586_B10529 [Cupriavidus phytorum]|uniref:Uncharacterized protein n=1 Tax=Cupriavidus taiwanensis TaxID=164546 RepID=A0A375CAA0_9BURK|nr:hypothetical protein CBM2586_B10529 [Cupriavidus taiwanensis]